MQCLSATNSNRICVFVRWFSVWITLNVDEQSQQRSPLPFFYASYRKSASKKNTQISRCMNTLSVTVPAGHSKSNTQAKKKKETKENIVLLDRKYLYCEQLCKASKSTENMPDWLRPGSSGRLKQSVLENTKNWDITGECIFPSFP